MSKRFMLIRKLVSVLTVASLLLSWTAVQAMPNDEIPPAAPTGLAALDADQTVSLTWTANIEPDLAGYNLYRGLSPTVETTGTPVNGDTLITDQAYIDSGLTNGTTYYYVVTAVDIDTNQSLASNTASAAPSAPTTFYVDNTVTCSNDGPTSGTLALPFCNISRGSAMAFAGDTVHVLHGTYAETVYVDNSGFAEFPITFLADPGVTVTGDPAGFGSAFVIGAKSYIVVDGFYVTQTKERGIFVDSSDHITIQNNHVTYAGINAGSNQHRQGIFLKNTIESLVAGNTADHNSCTGIRLTHGSDYNIVRDNVSFGNSSTIADPVVVVSDAAGIDVVDSNHNTLIHNTIYANEDSGINLYTDSGGGSTYNLAIANLSYGNGDHGIDNNGSPYNTLVGNTVHGNGTVGINFEGAEGAGSHHATILNNISVNNGYTPPEGSFGGNLRVDSQSVEGTTADYNLYNQGDAAVQIIWNDTNYTNLGALFTATGQEGHGRESDPLFVDPVSPVLRTTGQTYIIPIDVGDYHLSIGSPAIDSANSNAIGEQELDFDGNPRVDDPATPNDGAGVRTYDDRGAYEFQADETFTISGNAGTAGATLSYNDGEPKTVTADGTGDYSITVPYYWSGTVTPSKTGYAFTPTSLSYTHVLENWIDQDYAAVWTEYTLTVIESPDEGGSVNISPAGPYHLNDVVTLTPIPVTDWHFVQWSGLNATDLVDNGDGSWNLVMNGNKSVTAEFSLTEYTLTVTTVGSGSVTKDPDQATYHYDDDVLLTATPAAGWEFLDWSGSLTGNANPDTLTVDSNEAVTATFVEELSLTDLDLLQATDVAGPWSNVPGSFGEGFTMLLDPVEVPSGEYYYLDAANLVSNRPLADGSYGFFIDDYPDGYFAYWASRGVVDGAGDWMGVMWEIINGRAPIFYLKVTGTDYMLVDGLTFLSGGGETPLRIEGSYLLGEYTFAGTVKDDYGFTDDVSVDITFVAPLALTDLDLLQSTTGTDPWTDVPGSFAGGFTMLLDPAVASYYLDTANLVVNRPLADGYYEFLFDEVPAGFFTYWADRGVVSGATGWQGIMWNIINGDAPIFYLKVTGTSYMLVDGLTKALYGTDTHLRIEGSYWPGAYSFTGEVEDAYGFTDEVAVDVLFDDRPVALPQTVTTTEDTATAITLTAQNNYTSGTLTWTVLTDPQHGDLTGTAPNLTYTPDPDFNGDDSFTFKVTEGTVDSAAATVSITVTPVNDAPTAENDTYGTAEDTPLTVNAPGVLGNDEDIDAGDSLTAVLKTDVDSSEGELVLNTNGSFTFTPAAHFYGTATFTYAAKDGANAESDPATVSITVSNTIDFQILITIDPAGSGTVTRNKTEPYDYGEQVELTAVPAVGWEFDHWSGGLTGIENPQTITVDGDETVTAVFIPIEYTLTVNIVGSGSVTLDPDQDTYHLNDVVELEAVPAVGWGFDHWEGSLTGSENPEELTIGGNETVTAVFEQIEYSLTVTSLHGTVTQVPDQETYHYNDTVQLTANADVGWTFHDWSGDLVSTANPAQITITGDKSVTANYTQNCYTLTTNVTPPEGGSIVKDPAPNCNGTQYLHGTVVELEAVSNTGYGFSSWSGDLSGSTNPQSITMDGPKSVTATFALNAVNLTVNVTGSGTVTQDPEGPYFYGDEVTLTPVPAAGWHFLQWSGPDADELQDNGDGSWDLELDSSKSVTAEFARDSVTLTVTVEGSGTVTKDPPSPYLYSDIVTLTPVPALGWRFDHWSGTNVGDLQDNEDGSWDIELDGSKSVTAVFTQIEYTLDITIVGQGTVAKDPDQQTYHLGDVVELTADPDSTWIFQGWSGDASGSDLVINVTITGNMNITATFTQYKLYLPLVVKAP